MRDGDIQIETILQLKNDFRYWAIIECALRYIQLQKREYQSNESVRPEGET